jgi:hypothetical protein
VCMCVCVCVCRESADAIGCYQLICHTHRDLKLRSEGPKTRRSVCGALWSWGRHQCPSTSRVCVCVCVRVRERGRGVIIINALLHTTTTGECKKNTTPAANAGYYLVHAASFKTYHLWFEVHGSMTIAEVDHTLRRNWLECCGHMSRCVVCIGVS